MLKCILFDLDGTLLDSAPDIADALNDTLARHVLPPAPEATVRGWIGDGAQALLAKALAQAQAAGQRPPTLARAWPGFALDYAQRCGRRSQVHAGVPALLARLREAGVACALLTNKEGRFAHKLLVAHGLAEAFDVIVAGDTLPVKKPDPAVVAHALAALDAQAHEALLVGDSVLDVRTARAAGLPVWVVQHGYPGGALEGADAPDGFIASFEQFDPLGPALGLHLPRTPIAA
jgi:phosphoglycolate phosphatase